MIRSLSYAKSIHDSIDSFAATNVACIPNSIVEISISNALQTENYINDTMPLFVTLNLNPDTLIITFSGTVIITSVDDRFC